MILGKLWNIYRKWLDSCYLILAMESKKWNNCVSINSKINSSLGSYFLRFILTTNYLVLSKKKSLKFGLWKFAGLWKLRGAGAKFNSASIVENSLFVNPKEIWVIASDLNMHKIYMKRQKSIYGTPDLYSIPFVVCGCISSYTHTHTHTQIHTYACIHTILIYMYLQIYIYPPHT